MTAEISPTIGKWYRHENGELFEVVAVDEEDATVEIQYFDGTIEETDLDEWLERDRVSEPPRTGRARRMWNEDTENEYEAELNSDQTWGDPLQFVDRGEASGCRIELDAVDDADRYRISGRARRLL
jgi:hypothetical protein